MKTIIYSMLGIAVGAIAAGVLACLIIIDSVRPLSPYKGLAGGVDVRLNAGPYEEVSWGPSDSGEWTVDRVTQSP